MLQKTSKQSIISIFFHIGREDTPLPLKKAVKSRSLPIGKTMILQCLSDAKHYRRLNLA